MKRRTFITLLGGAVMAWPVLAWGQQKAKIKRLGFLWGLPPIRELTNAFDRGLADLGWGINGKNIAIDYRFADGYFDRLPALATELVNLGPDVIVAVSAPETSAAKRVANNLPIVFVAHGDPLSQGDIQSLSHPGGNITGLSQMHPELSTKQLDLLKQIAPGVSQIGVLWNAANPAKLTDWKFIRPAAGALGVALQSYEVRGPADFDDAFALITSDRPDALLTLADPLTVTFRQLISDFALSKGLPAMFSHRQFVEVGGLISYGANLSDLFYRAASYVDKILRGAKPADLPVEQPIKFELFLNLATAKKLGLAIPPTLLVAADEVIE
jgi:putative ABC transport system substrate-binding protein